MKECILILDNIRSVANVGSIFRTADCLGVSKIVLAGITPRPTDRFGRKRRDFAKVSLGAEKTVEWEYVKSFVAVYKKLKSDDCGILAVEQDKRSIPYYDYRPVSRSLSRTVEVGKVALAPRQTRDKCALIFGEETKGLPKSVLDKCDKILEIPMRDAMVQQVHHPKNLKGKALRSFGKTQGRQAQGKESLNVSVAAGIVVYNLLVEK